LENAHALAEVEETLIVTALCETTLWMDSLHRNYLSPLWRYHGDCATDHYIIFLLIYALNKLFK